MDLIRKISSGLRSSQDLSAAVAQVKNDDAAGQQAESKTLNLQEEEQGDDILLPGTEQDDADVFEDAAPALRQQQRQQHVEEEEEKKPGDSVKEDQQETPVGASPIRVRAPVSDEHGELEDDHDNVEGMEEEEEEDGEASHGSGESFDSALERMAASSEASYDTAVSPKVLSPVGSLADPAVPGNSPSVRSVSQQGAANGLHETFTGDSSSDTSVAGKSIRDKSGNGELAEGPGETVAAEAQAMPKANLTAEDEDGFDERDEDELSGDGQPEDENEEPTEDFTGDADTNKDVPLKIRAVPSDLNDNVSIPHTEYHGAAAAPEENGDEDNESLPLKVRAPASEPDSDSSFDAGPGAGEVTSRGWNGTAKPIEEIQARPFAQLSDLGRANVEEDSTLQEKLPEEILKEGIVNTMDTEALEQASNKPAMNREETDKILSDAKGGIDDDGEDGDKGENDEEYEEDEEDEEDNEEDGDEVVERSAALAALVRAADATAGAEPGPPLLGSAGPSLPARPTRSVRSSVPSLEPAPRIAQQPRSSEANPTRLSSSADGSQATTEIADGKEETREKLQGIRVKFLRLALRLGQSAENQVVSQVLYRLGLAEQLRGGRSNRNAAFSFDRASTIAEEQEAAGQEELDFSCTIMMLGKTGVGKSATINSIFDEAKTGTSAFSPATNKVQVITGHVHGIKVRVIDTPGLLPSVVDQRHNEKIMASVKGVIKKQSPDIVLYFDRLDMQSRDYGDLPLLRTITDTFGAAVWFNAIVVLTHASSAPPDGPNGIPLSYDMFVAHRSHVVQHTIRQAAGDMRLMNPVSLVENHTACRVNRSGQRVLPNGQVWKPQLLLLCFASKILAEANSLLKLQDNTPGRPFGTRSRVPPLPFLLSSLLQSRAQLKLPDEQMGDEDESDEELEEDEDSDEEEDYDQLPPFRRLAKEEIDELDEINRGNYFEELAERERLFQKKQWKEEVKRRRELKRRMAEAPTEQSQFVDEGVEDDMARSAAVPVPMPDMVLPPSFDSDNPSHRYRYLETANQWLVRPVLETHGWDHDNGYDGMSVEKVFVIADKVPTSVSGQITKDKKEANLNMECAASLKHGEGKVTLAGLDMQTVGKDVAYTLRSETRFSNFKGNKTTGGLALTLLGDTVSAGMKIEDRLIIGKRVKLVVNGGAITGAGDVAYGGSLEATLRDKEYPLSRTLSTLGVSIMDWHGDLAVGGNLQSQFILGKTMMVGRANLNNRGAGQISIRASSSEQLQMTLIGLLPIIRSVVNRLFGSQPQQ